MSDEQPSLVALVEKVRADQRQRWSDREGIAVESYFDQHPRLRDDATIALKLIYYEIVLRERAGASPQLEEYIRRFPEWAEQLAPLWELHRALESGQLLSSAEMGPETRPAHGTATSGPGFAIVGHEILEELGRGGMGVVYKARQVGLNRLVALKMILAGHLTSPAQLARFRAEAEAVAHLLHPNIVQVYEVGEQDGRPYFSMEFINGGSLAEALRGTPQPARTAAKLIQTLAQAIHAAHERGIVHRDLKPANILLMRPGDPKNDAPLSVPPLGDAIPKITDFGLAKHLDAGAGQTGSGIIVGTPSYMAPEQAEGPVRKIGPAADVYALGAILYELLTGRPPFKAQTQLATLRQVLAEEPVPISRFHVNAPRDLDTICFKCLQKEPTRRYGSALSLADDLERFLTDRPIHARRSSALERIWRWCRRNPLAAWLAVSVIGLLLLIAAGASLAALRLSRELARAENAERTAEQEKEATTDQLWKAALAQARAFRLSGRMGQRFESLKAIEVAARITRARGLPATEVRALRDAAVACLALTDLRVIQEWQLPTSRCSGSMDAALERYAYLKDDGSLHVQRVADHQQIASWAGPGKPYEIAELSFSPDGRWLLLHYVFAGGESLNVVLEFARPDRLREVLRVPGSGSLFTPDSRSLVVVHGDDTLGCYNLAQGTWTTVCRDFRAHHLALRRDGKELVCSDESQIDVRILDMRTGRPLRSLPHPNSSTALAWSDDNRLLATAAYNTKIYIWNGDSDRPQAVLEGHSGKVVALAFGPSGRLLASTSWDGTTRLWNVWSGKPLISGQPEGAIRGRGAQWDVWRGPPLFRSQHRLLQFSPDGRRLGVQHGDHMGIWEVADGRECRVLGPQSPRSAAWRSFQGQESIDYSPDGRLLASAGGDGVRLWDTATASELAHLPIGNCEATLFHPRRSQLFTYERAGLRSWSITRVPGQAGLQIGEPQTIAVPANTGWFRLCCTRDGRVLAVTNDHEMQILVLNVEAPSKRIVLANCRDVVSLAFSCDGKWLAAGMVEGDVGVSIWDAQSGRLVRRLPADKDGTIYCQAAFSPDGQWLLTGGQSNYRFWKVGSWEPGPVLARDNSGIYAGPIAFSRDGRLLAVAGSQDRVLLFDMTQERELARLTAPDARVLSRLCFHPDGTELAASTDNHLIQLWDLRALRAELRAMDLDW